MPPGVGGGGARAEVCRPAAAAEEEAPGGILPPVRRRRRRRRAGAPASRGRRRRSGGAPGSLLPEGGGGGGAPRKGATARLPSGAEEAGDRRASSWRRRRRRRRARSLGAPRLLELRLDVPHLFLGERLALRPRVFPRRGVLLLLLVVRPERRERVAGERVAGAVAHHGGRQLPAQARVRLEARALGVFLAALLDERDDLREVLRGDRGVVPLGVPGVQQLIQPAAHRHLAQNLLQRVAGEHLDHLAAANRLAAGRAGARRMRGRRRGRDASTGGGGLNPLLRASSSASSSTRAAVAVARGTLRRTIRASPPASPSEARARARRPPRREPPRPPPRAASPPRPARLRRPGRRPGVRRRRRRRRGEPRLAVAGAATGPRFPHRRAPGRVAAEPGGDARRRALPASEPSGTLARVSAASDAEASLSPSRAAAARPPSPEAAASAARIAPAFARRGAAEPRGRGAPSPARVPPPRGTPASRAERPAASRVGPPELRVPAYDFFDLDGASEPDPLAPSPSSSTPLVRRFVRVVSAERHGTPHERVGADSFVSFVSFVSFAFVAERFAEPDIFRAGNASGSRRLQRRRGGGHLESSFLRRTHARRRAAFALARRRARAWRAATRPYRLFAPKRRPRSREFAVYDVFVAVLLLLLIGHPRVDEGARARARGERAGRPPSPREAAPTEAPRRRCCRGFERRPRPPGSRPGGRRNGSSFVRRSPSRRRLGPRQRLRADASETPQRVRLERRARGALARPGHVRQGDPTFQLRQRHSLLPPAWF